MNWLIRLVCGLGVRSFLSPCRLPAEYLERLSDKAPNPWGVLKLTASQADQIASCSEANLPAALADWLGQPSRGLCAALARRPASSSRPACLALLGCHDPPGQVEAQFERFYLDTPASLQRLEADAVTVWRTCKHLPLVGRTWLHRWEEHCWALPDSFRKMPDDMLQALSNTRTFKSALLGRRLWEAVDHLVGLWHWHDRARVEGGGGVSPLQGTIPPVHPAADARDRPQAPRDLWLGNRTALPVRPGFAAGQGRG